MFPFETPSNGYKYSYPECNSQSTDASYSNLQKSRETFLLSTNSRDSSHLTNESTFYGKDLFPSREMFFSKETRRRNLFCKEEEEWEPEISKRLCPDDFHRAKTTSFMERRDYFKPPIRENTMNWANKTINFSNVNSLMSFQKKLPPVFNARFFEEQENNVKKEEDTNFSVNNAELFNDKNSRGLKNLSIRVRELVIRSKETTYKDIADQILKEMKRNKAAWIDNEKEEQNIKRRIYDALNVLVATEIFKKKGKTLVYDGTSSVMGHELMNKRALFDKAQILEKIKEKKEIIMAKQKSLQTILIKNLAVKSLLHRNYTLDKFQNPNEKFQFPFLLVSLSSNAITLKMNKNKNKLAVFSKTPLNIHGDIDVLIKLNMHKVDKKMIEKWFPKDVIHYLPENFSSEQANEKK